MPQKKATSKTKQTKPPAQVIKYLEKLGVKHDVLEHKTVYTAIDAANTLKKKLNQIAKSLLVKADQDYYLVLLPSDKNLSEDKLKKLLEKQKGKPIKSVKIPGEKIMSNLLKIRQGALSAFGKVHKLPVIVDKELEKTKKAVFPSGGFNHSVEMAIKDFVKMEDAVLANIGIKKKLKLVKKTPAKKKAATKKTKSAQKQTTTKKTKPAQKKTGTKKTPAKKKTTSNKGKKTSKK